MNKNAVHGDVSALSPSGVRLGTPALTSRSFKESDFVKVAEMLHRAMDIALRAQGKSASKLMKDFEVTLKDVEFVEALEGLRVDVESFSQSFPMPGFHMN